MALILDHQKPVITIGLNDGTSDLFLQGERLQFWPTDLSISSEMYMCEVTKWDIAKNTVRVKPDIEIEILLHRQGH